MDNQSKPKISILIPAYNVENYVGACIESIKNQKFKDYEVILVNDGSTDNTSFEILKSIDGDNRFVLIDNNINKGIVSVRLEGIAKAKGEYFIFLDSDDRLIPGALDVMYNTIREMDADIVDFSYVSFKNENYYKVKHPEYIELLKEQKPFTLSTLNPLINSLLKRQIRIHLWGKIYNKDLFKNPISFPIKKVTDGDDLLFNTELILRSKKIVIKDIPTIFYSVRADSTTRKRTNHSITKYLQVLLFWYNSLKKYCDMELLNRYMIERASTIGLRDDCFSIIRKEWKPIWKNIFNLKNLIKYHGINHGFYLFLLINNFLPNKTINKYLRKRRLRDSEFQIKLEDINLEKYV